MSEIIHVSKITLYQEPDRIRRAYIEGFEEPLVFGVHGGISKVYNYEPQEPHPATLDHIIAALGG